ncbi:SDR family NAD(P)-dependent oxidoreductase [Curtobacterium sp. 9128]|uniref:SDR family NAD(P)-dependent oxidoreductase n=1 Tax=Curtobacterium sp. 9128 TaxID=1793722 RepID=UPI0024820999|nr:SDR family NAD(P)-dependent oxidoreductase [Curtobacterium sp. 9128]
MTRVAVVTGGSAGLGRATVRELAARGWDVAVLARGLDGTEAAAAEVRATIIGNRVSASFADWYAAKTLVSGQQTEAEDGQSLPAAVAAGRRR